MPSITGLPGTLAATALAAGALVAAGSLLAGSPGAAAETSPSPRAAARQAPAPEPQPAPREPAVLRVPPDVVDAAELEARIAAQRAALPEFGVFAGFGFTDRREESGITFRHRIVDDAGIDYKPVHYDHGNGLAVADVDGDGRHDLYFLTQLGSNELWRNLGGGKFENATGRAGVAMTDRVSVSASFADVDGDGDADLYVTTVRTGNALFENDGTGRFTEVTERAGLAYSGHSSGAVFFDYDRDGRLDLFLVNVGRYTTDERGRGGYYVGRPDAFQAHTDPALAERSVLYRNLGDGTFRDVSDEVLLVDRSWSGDAAAADLDGDGWQDLYVLDMQGSDHFYQNVRGEFFVDRTAKYFPRTPPGAMGIKVFDWNRDGRLDLFLTDMHSDMIEEVGLDREKEKTRTRRGDVVLAGLEANILGNAFFEGTADGFRERSDEIGVESYWPWGVSVDDLNADGWDDLFVTASMNFPFRYGVNSVLLNDRGERYRDAETILGVEPRKGELTTPWFELDCPETAAGEGEGAGEPAAAGAGEGAAGREAAEGEAAEGEGAPPAAAGAGHHGHAGAAGQSAGGQAPAADFRWSWAEVGRATAERAPGAPHPLCRGLSGPVTVLAAKGSRASAVFDLDGDGDLDVVTNELNDVPQVLLSDLAERRPVRRLEVALVGTASNRDGLGARVTVTAGGLSQLELHDGKSGYLSQSSLPLYFGLGDATEVDRVEVLWPSGRRKTIERPLLGARLVVTEPQE